jgi:tRNA-specific 2-thiouridylase
VLGTHEGVIHYTVGQRKGLGVAAAEPLYVLRLEPERRRIVVGPRAALGTRRVDLGQINWLGTSEPRQSMALAVKLRSAQPPVAARLSCGDRDATVLLEEPAFGVAPGQACVFYEGTRVLGGGWIRRLPAHENRPAPATIMTQGEATLGA